MTVRDFLQNVEVQSEFKVCLYDYNKEERVFVDCAFYDCDICYMYVEDGILYIEIREDW